MPTKTPKSDSQFQFSNIKLPLNCQPVNNGEKFGVPWEVVAHGFDGIFFIPTIKSSPFLLYHSQCHEMTCQRLGKAIYYFSYLWRWQINLRYLHHGHIFALWQILCVLEITYFNLKNWICSWIIISTVNWMLRSESKFTSAQKNKTCIPRLGLMRTLNIRKMTILKEILSQFIYF